MARTALAIQEVLRNGAAVLTMASADAANGNVFPNDGNTVLVVKNGDGSPHTVTVKSVPCSHGRSGDVAQAVAAGAVAILGPFDPTIFSQADGTVNVDWTAATGMTVAARRQV